MKQSYRCWAEIDLDALTSNLLWLRQRIGPDVKILTVVKADAYGHGLKQIAARLMQSGTDVFGVANLVEAQSIRSVGKGWPILMLGACLPDEVETAVRDNVMPTLSSWEEARQFTAAARKSHRTLSVHIKVNTGMGRLGAAPAEAISLIEKIRQLGNLEMQGFYTHYSSAEDDAAFSRHQRVQFCSLVKQLTGSSIQIPFIHANNSAAILHQPETTFNMIRPGLLVYGVVPAGRRRLPPSVDQQLRPALSFFCRVSFVREIRKGAPVSYGHTFIARRKMRVATITAGYGDGYLRSGSDRAEVLIGGRRCPIVGRITMDQMLADVSAVSNVRPGDAVVLIGRQGDACITASDVAKFCGTVPWEVLTNINYRVPRIYRGAQAA